MQIVMFEQAVNIYSWNENQFGSVFGVVFRGPVEAGRVMAKAGKLP